MATTTQSLATRRAVEVHASKRTGTPRRVQVAQALGFVALVAALVGALGPAQPIRTAYSWPPRTLPHGHPSRLWYTPLLLTHRVPESLSARFPCKLASQLPAADRPTTVLATVRYPDRTDGLLVTRTRHQLTFGIGTRAFDRVPLTGSVREGACVYQLVIANGTWSLRGGPNAVAHGGQLRQLPIVNGVFSGLDLRSEGRPSVDIAVVPQSTHPIARQEIAWLIAAVCALGALLLVSVEPRSQRRYRRLAMTLKAAPRAARPVDGLVAALLLTWWVLSPSFVDDGWVLTRQRAFQTSGGFSNYFDTFGSNFPLGYWLEWLQHWLSDSTTTLVLLRIPALVCLAATWILCRAMLGRALGSRSRRDGPALWGMAAAFAVLSLAWDMALRPEPVVALLTAGVLACTLAFVERRTVAPLALAVVLVALAVPEHPSGIVSIAPLLAAGPALIRWTRLHFSVATTIVPTAIALLLTVATLGSDVAHRRSDEATYRAFGNATAGWRDEVWRYQLLSLWTYGPGLRRASVALFGFVLLVYLFRTHRAPNALRDLATRALAIGLVLLAATPSKWPYHFGTLLALAAVATGVETSRIRNGAGRKDGSRTLPWLWLAGAIVVAAWSWTPRLKWGVLDLRTLDWTLGFESFVSLATLAALLPLIALVGAIIVDSRRRGRTFVGDAAWRVARWAVPLVAVPLIVFTFGVLSVDAAKTHSWTLARQNLDALRGNAGCGLADDLVSPSPVSMHPLAQLRASNSSTAVPAWLPAPPVAHVPRFVLGPVTSDGAQTPWFAMRRGSSLGLFAAGMIGPSTRLALQFARLDRGRPRVVSSAPLPPPSLAHASEDVLLSRDVVTWQFLAPTAGAAPRGADAVRVTLRGNGTIGAALSVTAPVTYARERLARTLATARTHALTSPFFLTFFPCARQPRLGGGIIETPTALVGYSATLDPLLGRGAGSLNGLLDLYPLTSLPLVDPSLSNRDGNLDTGQPPTQLALYRVDTRIPGAKVASAEVIPG